MSADNNHLVSIHRGDSFCASDGKFLPSRDATSNYNNNSSQADTCQFKSEASDAKASEDISLVCGRFLAHGRSFPAAERWPSERASERAIKRMDSAEIRASPGNIRVTAVEDASQAGSGGITYLDYSRVHVVRAGPVRARASSSSGSSLISGVGGGAVVPVEDAASTSDDRRTMAGAHSAARVKEVAQEAAEACRTARQICVQNGNAGAERAAGDALSLIDQIAATTFQKS